MAFDWSILRTDRSQNDVEEANRLVQKYLNNEELTSEEQELWDAGLYGKYGYIDFNRVGAAINELSAEFNELAISNTVSALTNYVKTSELNPEVADLYLSKVSQIRRLIILPDSTPNAPVTMENFTFDSANDIEKILAKLQESIENIRASWVYSGDVFSGEV